MSERRPLRFESLQDVLLDVETLLSGYQMLGNWSLGQVCQHLAKVLDMSRTSSPEAGPHVLEERTRTIMKRRVFSSGVIAAGVDVPGSPLPDPADTLDDRAEVERLREAISAYLAHTGPIGAHPLFGALTTDEGLRFQCVHASHHLSFLIPVQVS